jgi:ABC-type multidrug transport system fused ATPase/permease subunit
VCSVCFHLVLLLHEFFSQRPCHGRIGAQGLGQVEPALTALAKARKAAKKVIETADRQVVINAFSDAGQTLQNVVGNISFKNVFFAYPSRPDQSVCHVVIVWRVLSPIKYDL